MTPREVQVIPATKNIIRRIDPTARKRRVAGYARVSTDKDEQFTSYEAQVDYYTQFIKRHADWEFVKVYTDEGISGLNTKHREGFNEMIRDALRCIIFQQLLARHYWERIEMNEQLSFRIE